MVAGGKYGAAGKLKYDITFTISIDHPEESLLDLVNVQGLVPFQANVTIDGDNVVVVCRGVESSGLMALPEAVRKAQVALSHAFRGVNPSAAARGGLLWGDVLAADVRRAG